MISSVIYQPADEKALFLLIAGGDEAAFESLFHLYVPRIEPVIFKMVKSETVVKDIIQDVFLNLWVSREKLADIDSPTNWIFKIVYNRTYTWLEQQTRREKSTGRLHPWQQDVAGTNDTEESILFAETARLVRQAIHQLPPQTRKIYLLSRESGMKLTEIAGTLNISVQTVKNTLSNAGKAIRQYLVQHGIVLPWVLLLYWLS